MESNRNLTHDEIWDDSALVNSWNAALDEYNKYHSIYAAGGTVNDLPVTTKATLDRSAKPETESTGEPIESDEAADGPTSDETRAEIPLPQQLNGSASSQNQVNQGVAPAMGPQLLAGIQDDGLKKLLMSWYYAGYYTGLFEGKQQAQSRGGTFQ